MLRKGRAILLLLLPAPRAGVVDDGEYDTQRYYGHTGAHVVTIAKDRARGVRGRDPIVAPAERAFSSDRADHRRAYVCISGQLRERVDR